MASPNLGYGGSFVGGQYVLPGEALRDPYELQQERFTTEGALLKDQRSLAKTGTQRATWELQRDKEAWDLKKQMASQQKDLASGFLSTWSNEVADFKKMFTGGIEAGQGGILGELKGISDEVGKAYTDFQSTYADTTREFIEGAREESQARRGIANELRNQAIPDYQGVEGRARADVAAQSGLARREAARAQMGTGVDPSSGKFGALQRRSFLDEAKSTAINMNLARRGEKERAGEYGLKAMSVLDPTKSASVGLQLQKTGTGLLSQKADIAGQFANVADIYGKNVLSPLGTMAGFQLGQSSAATAIPMNF